MRETCARALAAALMTGAIAFAVGMPALFGTPGDLGHSLLAPPSSLQRTVRAPSFSSAPGPSAIERARSTSSVSRHGNLDASAQDRLLFADPNAHGRRAAAPGKPRPKPIPKPQPAPSPAPQSGTRELASTSALPPAATEPPAVARVAERPAPHPHPNGPKGKAKGHDRGNGNVPRPTDTAQPSSVAAPPTAAATSTSCEPDSGGQAEPDNGHGQGNGNGGGNDNGNRGESDGNGGGHGNGNANGQAKGHDG